MSKVPAVFNSLEISKLQKIDEKIFSEFRQDLKVCDCF
jgi:hypothetical protein